MFIVFKTGLSYPITFIRMLSLGCLGVRLLAAT